MTNNMRRLKNTILYIFGVQLVILIFFSICRLILFLHNYSLCEGLPFSQIIPAFRWGFFFDIVPISIIFSIPIVVLLISLLFKPNKYIPKFVSIYSCILFSICLFASCADIPYFNYFFKHIDASIWGYLEQPSMVISMTMESSSYLLYFGLFVIITVLFCFLLRCLRKKLLTTNSTEKITSSKELIAYICTILFVVSLSFIGMRGGVSRGPIRISDGYYCNNSLLNQLGVNPIYSLIRTSTSKSRNCTINLMDEQTAIETVRKNLNIDTDSMRYVSPIARYIPKSDTILQKNVVVILMESMASHLLDDTTQTPFLNQLIKKSTYFSNAYSAGTHTRNAVFGTLYSLPPLLSMDPFLHDNIAPYDSWPVTMNKLGYSTLYFTTHIANYDNIRANLMANNVETFVSEENYPPEEICWSWGCTDEFLFRNAIPILSETAEKNTFFATLLTTCNHPPFTAIPNSFQSNFEDDLEKKAVEYSDYSIRMFFENAQKEHWFNNTIFVLLGDHGTLRGITTLDYDVALAHHHIPIIIYDPTNEKYTQVESLAGQIDVFPTIMGMLGHGYINNTLGIDLSKEKRSMLMFSSEDDYCCIDSSHYFVCRKNGMESLYHYTDLDQKDYIDIEPQKVKVLKDYACSMIQTTNSIVKAKRGQQ